MRKRITECPIIIGEKWGSGYLISYPVSYRYNGGISIDGKHYDGFQVKAPKFPKGFQVKNVGCGLQLNARPPYATLYIQKHDGERFTKRDLKKAIAETT